MNDKQWSLFRKIRTIYEYYNVSPYKTYNSRPIGFFFSSSQSQWVSGPLGSDIHMHTCSGADLKPLTREDGF